ncbi:MAG: Penicillin-insensitive murein endopeptidase precursor [Betaproteobacteria bacterium ADurb.Bin341]|nr:MAG: Penicillin-insensitive murein endopeptidase precursor [Betaproteobacteria bacterium ADurb.Bin341]
MLWPTALQEKLTHAVFRSQTALAALLLSLGAHAQPPNWPEIKTPSPGPAAAIGSGSNGCLAGAEALPEEGHGYVSIRRGRNRFYGHPALLGLIGDLGKRLGKSDALLMIGDISQPRGGPMSSSHRSHQNGLDVDIWLSFAASARIANEIYPEKTDPPSLVATDGQQLAPTWGNPQRLLLKTLAEDPRVDRLFINPAIKRALCETEPRDQRAWLRKLRPWWGHDAHVHVRIKCPSGNADCAAQAPLPAGDGCGNELAWWFSDEAKMPSKPASPESVPIMPEACKALLPKP